MAGYKLWEVKTSICLIQTSKKYEKVPVRGEPLHFGSECENVSPMTTSGFASERPDSERRAQVTTRTATINMLFTLLSTA